MISSKDIISAIEAMEQERTAAINEANNLKVQVWQLKAELDEKEKELERWKDIAFSSNTI